MLKNEKKFQITYFALVVDHEIYLGLGSQKAVFVCDRIDERVGSFFKVV
jgi:hypothetical protein